MFVICGVVQTGHSNLCLRLMELLSILGVMCLEVGDDMICEVIWPVNHYISDTLMRYIYTKCGGSV